MTAISTANSAASLALAGLNRAQRMQSVAMQAVTGGSLDPNAMAEAAALLQGGQTQEAAAAVALAASLKQQRSFIDILA